MATETTTQVPKVEFIQSHKPGLVDGDYKVKVTQRYQTLSTKISEKTPNAEKQFSIQGLRFSLTPDLVYSVFPAESSLGDHANVLPHIALSRSTLPWERTAESGNTDTPWLALLLFEESEKPEAQQITLSTLMDTGSYTALFPGISLERGQSGEDTVTVIDVDEALLRKIMPALDDLPWLAHVRQGLDNDDSLIGEELAVIMCNRLPASGGQSTVHLVSLEERYTSSGFDFQSASTGDTIRLLSLKSWSFSCLDENQSFKGLLKNADQGPLQKDALGNQTVDTWLGEGFVPLTHKFRNGESSVSWYHGPLTPSQNSADVLIPARASDELLLFNESHGMFDVSYAAAWQLGRMLALQSKGFSIGLYNWKRSYARQQKEVTNNADNSHWVDPTALAGPDSELPETLSSWLYDLNLLIGVPFNYLVSDASMLPIESIRFFQVDIAWLDCLLDGAFSIGRIIEADQEFERLHHAGVSTSQTGAMTGFLLRSAAVSGWPGLLVEGYATAYDDENRITGEEPMTMLRMERLSDNVLFCLFEGQVKTVDIHLKAETLHFGVDEPDGVTYTDFYKELRNDDGSDSNLVINAVPFSHSDQRVVNIDSLASSIKTTTSGDDTFSAAQFALQMIEGAESVRFAQESTNVVTF